jgi:hypothetical protein
MAMDKGIDDLIYIILGVVFVVAQFLRKKKPAQEKAPESAPVVAQQEEEEDPAEFWKHFLGVPEVSSAEPEAVLEKVPPVEIKSESFQRIDPGIEKAVHPVSSLTDHTPEDFAVSVESTKEPEAEQEDEPFNLRDAVIHSVILERKYV